MRNVKNTMIDWLLSSIAPHLCLYCGGVGRLICHNCKSYITQPVYSECLTCGRKKQVNTCRYCRQFFDETIIVGLRQGALQRLIGTLKFQYTRAAAKECAQLLAPYLRYHGIDYIVPIPAIRSHVRVRGYDHMMLIAVEVSRLINVPIAIHLKAISRTTQHHLGRAERMKAASSLFKAIGQLETGKRYMIVDDIITTGSTVRQAAMLLRAAGATHVSVAAIARQPSTKPSVSVKMIKVPHETIVER